jgi:hypothetical protein
MTVTTIFIVFGPPFGVFLVCTVLLYFQTRKILRIVKKIDESKANQLTRIEIPILDKLLWVNPIAFRTFVKVGDSLGSPLLAKKLRLYRRTERVGRYAWGIAAGEVLVLLVLFFFVVLTVGAQ